MALRRIAIIAGVVLVLALSVFGISRFQRKVDVTTGTRLVCTYGHTISESIKTVRVPADKAALYSVKTVSRTCDKHKQAEALYEEAQAALAKGDTKSAKNSLAKVIAIDPSLGQAQQQLESIAQGQKPKPDAGGGEPVTPVVKPKPEPGGGGAVALTAWVPSNIEGFTAQRPLVEAMGVTRQYFPSSNNDVVQLVIVAEQSKTAKGAQQALAQQVKSKYPTHADSVTIGKHSAYYGTDGTRFAVIGFTDGAVMVAIELGAKPEVDPNGLKDLLVKVARQLP